MPALMPLSLLIRHGTLLMPISLLPLAAAYRLACCRAASTPTSGYAYAAMLCWRALCRCYDAAADMLPCYAYYFLMFRRLLFADAPPLYALICRAAATPAAYFDTFF